jgi:phage head maturation protease
MDRGDVDQCSFSFTVPQGGAEWTEDRDLGCEIRTVNKISRLFDVSVVTYPAYTQTSADLRSNADILSERQYKPAGDGSLDRLRCELDIACGVNP